ncbi:hypothetical protein CsSME_00010032 [Camellia sinensis var. sinensis]
MIGKTSTSLPSRVQYSSLEFNYSSSQPTSYGRGRGEPVRGGRVMSRSALGGSFIRRGRGGGGSAKVITQKQTDKGKGKV